MGTWRTVETTVIGGTARMSWLGPEEVMGSWFNHVGSKGRLLNAKCASAHWSDHRRSLERANAGGQAVQRLPCRARKFGLPLTGEAIKRDTP